MFKAGAGGARLRFPEDIFPIEGFIGVHDAPQIRILVMESGIRTAIVSVELVNVSGDGLDIIRSIVSRVTDTFPENVWVHITHAIATPHIPNDPDKKPTGPINEHMDQISAESARKQRSIFLDVLTRATSFAAESAMLTFTEAQIGYGSGLSEVNINRDVETPFGWWINLNPDGFSDKEMRILKIEDTHGKLLAVLVNYALKPCAIDNSQRKECRRLISSDVPGLACEIYESKTGTVCLYTMGAAGDQVPREMTILENVLSDGSTQCIDGGVEKGLQIVERLGAELASDICRIADTIHCSDCEEKLTKISAGARCSTKQRMDMHPTREATFQCDGEISVDSDIIALGNIAFVAAKPELNSITGRQLKERSPYQATFLLTMTNGEMKYMPDKTSYEKITWESQSSMLMPGAAEAWLDATIGALQQLKAQI